MAFDVYHQTWKNGKLSNEGAKYKVYDDDGRVAGGSGGTAMTLVTGAQGIYEASLDPSGWTRHGDGAYLIHMFHDGKETIADKSTFLYVVLVDDTIYPLAHEADLDTVISTLGTPAGTDLATDIAENQTDIDTVLSRLTSARAGYLDNLSGGAVALNSTVAKEATLGTPADTDLATDIANVLAQANKIDSVAMTAPSSVVSNSLADYLFNKDGSKTYDPSTDSLEAIRDRGDSAWGASGVASYTIDAFVNAAGGTPKIFITPKKNGQLYAASTLNVTVYKSVPGGTMETKATITESSTNTQGIFDKELGFTPAAGESYLVKGTVTMDTASKTVCDGFVAFG